MIRQKICVGTFNEIESCNNEHIKILNSIFKDVELSIDEERTLIWLSGNSYYTLTNIISAFSKVKN